MFTVSYLIFLIFLLIRVIFITLLERKILGLRQTRLGPNKRTLIGLTQPLLDGIKLLFKYSIIPSYSNKILFFLSPIITFLVIVRLWNSLSFYWFFRNFYLSLLFTLACIGISVYRMLLSGWSSNSKFRILGRIRRISQSISYEISLSLTIFGVILLNNFFSFFDFKKISSSSLILMTLPILIIWYFSCVAECNRAPFDFSEGESELVSGFNTEYSSGEFALIFVGEYGIILFFRVLTSILFFRNLYIIIIFIFFFSLLLIRSRFPRYRYDKLITLCWQKFLPVTIFLFIFYSLMSLNLFL